MNRESIGRAIAVAVLVVALGSGGGASAGDKGDKKVLDEIRALLVDGKAADAFARAKTALVSAGDDMDLLDVAADAAAAMKLPDEALWFEHAARCAATRCGMDDRARTFAAKCDALEPADLGERAPLDATAAAQLEAAKLCARKRCFVNAVQILSRLEATPFETKAQAELEKIYADKQAVAALLDSKVAVPRTVTDRKARAKAAKEDAKHATWETALKIDTMNYTVVTDAGADIGQNVATAMEPMNRFYRRVFHYKDKPGEKNAPTPRCTVRVFKSKAEMESIAPHSRNVLGFYDPNDNSVTIYDPRSEGMPFASMWSTLFHEASHQFTAMISGEQVPSWLNEGTASYFEGAVLRADGRVDTNLVPPDRLDGCMEALGTRSPSVREVLSFSKPESYPDDYYPVGWALVYFLRNYEDDKLDRVYEKAYGALLDSYRPGGAAASSKGRGAAGMPTFERFTKFLIADLKQPGVATYEAFEERFKRWMTNLESFHAGPPIAAHDFADRAAKHATLGHKEEAEDDYRHALEKAPDLHVALVGLGELLATAGRKDEALACFRRAAESLRRDPTDAGYSTMKPADAQDLARAALARATKLEPELGAAFAAMTADLAPKALAQADKYVAAKMPRNALRVLDAASLLLTGQADLEDRRREIAQTADVDVLLPRAVDLRPGAERVWASPGWTSDGTKFTAAKQHSSLLVFDAGLGDRWRFEATIRPGPSAGENPFAGVIVGADAEGEWKCVGTEGESLAVYRVFTAWRREGGSSTLTKEQFKSFHLTLEARPRLLRVLVDGKVAMEQEFLPAALRGGVGLVVNDASAEFADVRLAY